MLVCIMTVLFIERHESNKRIEAIEAEYEQTIRYYQAQLADYQAKVVSYDTAPAKLQAEAEAEEIAKVLYGQCKYNSAEAQRAVCWLIVNRVESSLFPNDVVGVCQQDSQWMGYSSENPIEPELYDIALEVVNAWHSGAIRLMSTDYLFMTWTKSQITFRNMFEEKSNTKYLEVN